MHLRKTRLAALTGIAALALAACGVEFHVHHQQHQRRGSRAAAAAGAATSAAGTAAAGGSARAP